VNRASARKSTAARKGSGRLGYPQKKRILLKKKQKTTLTSTKGRESRANCCDVAHKEKKALGYRGEGVYFGRGKKSGPKGKKRPATSPERGGVRKWLFCRREVRTFGLEGKGWLDEYDTGEERKKSGVLLAKRRLVKELHSRHSKGGAIPRTCRG